MLTNKKIDKLLRDGRKTRALDASGLYLQVRGSTQASWLLRYTIDGRAREMGLGPYPRVPLAEARRKATEARARIGRGEDPLAATSVRAGGDRQTLAHAAETFYASNQSRWRNAKVRKQWLPSLEKHCGALWTMPVAAAKGRCVLMEQRLAPFRKQCKSTP
jgi:hypothetical protein